MVSLQREGAARDASIAGIQEALKARDGTIANPQAQLHQHEVEAKREKAEEERPWDLTRVMDDSGAEPAYVLTMPPGDFDTLMVQMNVPAVHFQRMRQERSEVEAARLYALPEAVAARASRAEADRLYALPEAVAARAEAVAARAARQKAWKPPSWKDRMKYKWKWKGSLLDYLPGY